MKYLLLVGLFVGSMAQADVIIGPSVKYGVNGYSATGTPGSSSSSASSTSKNGKVTSTSNSSNSVNGGVSIQDRYQAVVGLKIQTVPCWGGLSFGGGVYADSTVEFNIGLRL